MALPVGCRRSTIGRLTTNGPAVLLGVLLVAATSSPDGPPTVIRADVGIVRLDAVAVDGQGRPVSGLGPSDFEVTEDGRPVTLTTFEAVVVNGGPDASRPGIDSGADDDRSRQAPSSPTAGRRILVFFDDVHLSAESSERVRSQVGPVLARELRAGDWLMVVAPESGLSWTVRGSPGRALLPDLLRRLSGHLVRDPFRGPLTEWEAMRLVEGYAPLALGRPAALPGQRDPNAAPAVSGASEMYEVAQRRIRKTLGALQQAVESLTSLPGHKELLLFSEGFILAPPLAGQYDRVIDEARRAQVVVSVVDPRGLTSGLPQAADPAQPATSRLPPGVLLDGQVAGTALLSSSTGGDAYGANDVAEGVRQALAYSSTYYLLGYEPPASGDSLRRVKVRVLREGIRVRARDRYFVKRLAPERSRAEQALVSVEDEFGLALRARAEAARVDGRGQADVTVHVVVSPPAGAGRPASLNALLQARRLEGGTADYETRVDTKGEAPWSVELRGLRLKPGRWQIRVVIEDRHGGAVGSSLLDFETPAR